MFAAFRGILYEIKEDGREGMSKGRLFLALLIVVACIIWLHSYFSTGNIKEISDNHFYLIETLILYNFGKHTGLVKKNGKIDTSKVIKKEGDEG